MAAAENAVVIIADREQRAVVSQLRLAVGGKLMRAMRLLPQIDPSKGEQDVAGDQIWHILVEVTTEDLDYLSPPMSPDDVRTVAEHRAKALKAANLDVLVKRVASGAERLAHMVAIGATGALIGPMGFEDSLRAAVDELCARIPPAQTEEA